MLTKKEKILEQIADYIGIWIADNEGDMLKIVEWHLMEINKEKIKIWEDVKRISDIGLFSYRNLNLVAESKINEIKGKND